MILVVDISPWLVLLAPHVHPATAIIIHKNRPLQLEHRHRLLLSTMAQPVFMAILCQMMCVWTQILLTLASKDFSSITLLHRQVWTTWTVFWGCHLMKQVMGHHLWVIWSHKTRLMIQSLHSSLNMIQLNHQFWSVELTILLTQVILCTTVSKRLPGGLSVLMAFGLVTLISLKVRPSTQSLTLAHHSCTLLSLTISSMYLLFRVWMEPSNAVLTTVSQLWTSALTMIIQHLTLFCNLVEESIQFLWLATAFLLAYLGQSAFLLFLQFLILRACTSWVIPSLETSILYLIMEVVKLV